jgi:hypothetical protein
MFGVTPDAAALVAESHPGWAYIVSSPPISPDYQDEPPVEDEIPLPQVLRKPPSG